jgi:hypothetical protein
MGSRRGLDVWEKRKMYLALPENDPRFLKRLA